jgi:8-oxo-dGTP pyrophosphatase MutT (NUDIX family)
MPTENTDNFYKRDVPIVTVCKRFNLKHIFRSGGVIWVKSGGKDYYLVFKSLSRPARGIQLPGGRIEKYENPSDTIIREIHEETGLETRIVCPLGLMMVENPKDQYSNLQLYYILKPVYPININERWRYTDRDNTKQELECWFVPIEKDPSFLAGGQDNIINLFKQWLEEHKKPSNSTSINSFVPKNQFPN